MKLKALVGVLAVAGLAMPGIASATNGYFSHGYGMTAKGMGGASTAMAKDAMGGANNPASMAFVGDRLDVGVDWFSPERSAKREGAAFANFSSDSDSTNFFVPEFGYNMMLGEKMSLGITIYGNGGMNTDYQSTSAKTACDPVGGGNLFCDKMGGGSGGKVGVNLEQLIVAPTFAYKVNASNSIGVSPLFVYQRFSANGIEAFGALSSDPTHLAGTGHDSSTGWGVRLGWQGNVTDTVTLGATYSPKINMSKFKRYAGLFAEQGDFDIPMNWNLGVAFKATPALTVALDYQHIDYSGVKSISNSGLTGAGTTWSAAIPGDATQLGASNGLGFGWSSVDVVKLGVEYKYNDALTLRAGINHGDNPIKSGEQTFNILAPGVVTDHYTLGATYGVTKDSEITVAYMHAQEKSVSGATSAYFGGGAVGGTETIKMYQNSLGIAYGMKF